MPPLIQKPPGVHNEPRLNGIDDCVGSIGGDGRFCSYRRGFLLHRAISRARARRSG